ncbi:putative DNA polymerase III subunit beta [Pseudorhizobium banfieldiae]|uniref:Beta sliding clamp n=1 Tax=Pseudorhizobium banfieldiae TaxID=1125847 RepID=L0NDH6_9HYPH|nr:DNA polymerase III subunit beta [Pseudorhizobium banfieldiae]CAD6606062.1 DNA polymerase III subunit beta [arsenite-oxidising bacterium NT-25]CCF19120.1 putative DNA polymerase III subunit beta [Pseudorhizobium banfieldiae]
MNAIANIAATVSTASLDYSVFKKAVLNATKVIDKRNTIPILSTMLIKATRNGALVTGTDCDMITTTFVPGKVESDFVALVDAHKLKAVMDKVKDAADINFVLDGDRLVASIGKLNLTLQQTHQEENFVSELGFSAKLKQSNCAFVLPSATLATILAKIEFAISTEETRYYLNGVFMHINEIRDKLTFVTTDGHRLGCYEMDVPAGAGAMPGKGVLIPRKTVGEVLRMLKRKGCPEDTLIRVTDSAISFAIGEDELLESKQIDGTFPDYRRVMPTANKNRPSIHTAPFIDALKQASAVMTERGKAVKLTFRPGHLMLTCRDPEFGTASTEIPVSCDFELEVGFNAGYLLDILGQMDGGTMMELEDAGSPGVIKDGALEGITYVLMPMRV